MVGIEALWPYKHKTHRTYKPSYPQTLLLALRHSQGRICTCLMLNASSNYCNQSWCRSLMFLKGWLCEDSSDGASESLNCPVTEPRITPMLMGVTVTAKCTLASLSEVQAQHGLVHACINAYLSAAFCLKLSPVCKACFSQSANHSGTAGANRLMPS